MQTDRWQKIESIFHLALERPEQERAAFLAKVCAGDTVTQLEVEALLAMHDQGGLLEEGALGLMAPVLGLSHSDEDVS